MAGESIGIKRPQEIVPNPDPSVLTVQLIDRAIKSLDEKLGLRFDVVLTRIEGVERAVTVAHEDAVRVPTMVDRAAQNLRELLEGKIDKLDIQFQERTAASSTAIAAALQAAKEAVGEQNKSSAQAIAKSDTSTAKQIDQMVATLTTSTKALDDKIIDLKDRLVAIDNRSSAFEARRTGSLATGEMNTRTTTSIVAIIVSSVIAMVSLAFTFFNMRGR